MIKDTYKKLNALHTAHLSFIKGGSGNTGNNDDPNIIMDDTDIF